MKREREGEKERGERDKLSIHSVHSKFIISDELRETKHRRKNQGG